MPFYELDRDTPARVVLEQVGPATFRIIEPFRYVDTETGEHFVVPDPRWGEQVTDLASVPSILLWLVPRYGQHTLPALLHDQLVNHDLADHREHADRIFRDAMGEQGVRFLRRWVMWAAVSIATIVRGGRWRLVPIALWLLAFGALSFRLTPPFAAWHVWPFTALVEIPWWAAVLTAVLGPPVLSALWRRRYLVGVMSGYGAVLFAVPVVAIVLALGVYWVLEWAMRPFDSRKGRAHVPGEPPPAKAEVVDRSRSAPPASGDRLRDDR